jgi:ABC-2 type transport system permease protein
MLKRIWAVIQKEFSQTLRDRSSMILLFGLPVIQVLLFGYAINMNIRHIPLGVVDQSKDFQSRALVENFVNSEYFDWKMDLPDEKALSRAMDAGQVQAGLIIPPNFAGRIARSEAQALFWVDGSDMFTSQSAYNAATTLAAVYPVKLVSQKLAVRQALTASTKVLYNPDFRDLWFVIPGLLASLLQSQTIATIAMAIVREREAGTIEQILVTPIRPFELILGKVIPNLALCVLIMALIVAIAIWGFGMPFQGSFGLFLGLSTLYMGCGLGLGILISSTARNTKQALQLVAVISLLGLILSGFIFPRYSMPAFLQGLGYLFPVTYFIPIARGIINKGIGLEYLVQPVLAMGVYLLAILVLATLSFKKNLE